MKLQTKIPLEQQRHNQIDYNSKLLLFGSCFSEHIGEKFEYFKFQNSINPCGILFQPLAIEKVITRAINEDYFSDKEVFLNGEQWCCYDVHSSLNCASQDLLLTRLNTQLDFTNEQLKTATHLVITIGTSWVYRHIATDEIVANCHKVPQKQFLKELLTVNEISESLQSIVSLVRSINNNVSIIFTVSPVRHLKDGFIENTQSKSHLVAAIHEVVEPRKKLFYFPSFEIMMDELRDYRFYKEDLIHPNKTAIQYIWDRFSEVWITTGSHKTMNEVDVVQKGINHKPFNENSDSYRDFLKNIEEKQKSLIADFQHIKF